MVVLRWTLVSDTLDWLDKSMVRKSYGGPCGSHLMPLPRLRQKHRAVVDLMQVAGFPMVPLNCVATNRIEGIWRTTLVAKMRAIRSHLQDKMFKLFKQINFSSDQALHSKETKRGLTNLHILPNLHNFSSSLQFPLTASLSFTVTARPRL